MKKQIKLYNVMFPLWMILFLVPGVWLLVVPGNFIIDSIVLLISCYALKIADKKSVYKKSILPVFLFGLLADALGSAFAFSLVLFFELGHMGDELYITLPALFISMVLIFVFDYYISFRKIESKSRRNLALIFAIATAPYTFLVPSSLLYNY